MYFLNIYPQQDMGEMLCKKYNKTNKHSQLPLLSCLVLKSITYSALPFLKMISGSEPRSESEFPSSTNTELNLLS